MRVLVAEDEVDIQFLYRAWLTRERFDVTIAGNGEDAVEAAESTSYDCIILDVMMPRLDGLETCRRIRASSRGDVPIIMVSALARSGDVEAGLEAGADAYIDKPVRPAEVVDRIRELIETGAC